MHRQSLGSPASKLHIHDVLFAGDGALNNDIDTNFTSDVLQTHRKDKPTSCSAVGAADDHRKSPKHILISSSSTRLVHLIPILTFLCFLILYLSSHDPSGKDLAQFSGFATISSKNTVIDSIDMDALAIGSMRNLQQEEERHRFRLHRKLGQ